MPLALYHRSETATSHERRRVLVFGASGHAMVILDMLHQSGGYDVIGLLDDYKPVGTECLGRRVIGTSRDLSLLQEQYTDPGMIVAVGDNWQRARIVDEILRVSPRMNFVTLIHPSAQIGLEVRLGPGTVIMAGAVVNPGSRVGPFCIVNTRASLDHESTMDEFASLGPAATTGGNVHVGAYSNIGIGATVLPMVSVGRHTVLGAGSVAVKSIPDEVVAYGVPARIIRARQPGDNYLIESAPGRAKAAGNHG
jgi:sugar O-acyltransferase (sialic acid O-acetyltransferase NeuD family)